MYIELCMTWKDAPAAVPHGHLRENRPHKLLTHDGVLELGKIIFSYFAYQYDIAGTVARVCVEFIGFSQHCHVH